MAVNRTFRSHYTVEQIEDLIEHGSPIIQDGHWFRWDVEAQEYVDTGITADSETAAEAAEAAQVAAEYAQGKAEDAQDAAETAQGLAEDARDAAAASAESIAASAAQIDANTARIDYVALREEEDRQILFGSVVEAAEDEYSELRSAPIHNAITIGGSVYPRMDRTRMAIDAIKGRTVAFNQLVTNGNFPNTTGWTAASASISASSNVLTMTTTGIGYCETSVGDIINGHKYLFAATINTNSTNMNAGLYKSGTAISGMYQSGNWSASGRVVRYSVWSASSTYTSATVRVRHNAASASSTTIENVMLIDLTAMYGTTLADSIYAMEQATTGAGVAYVRQRLDLDYYAYNAGELTAPVVSGVGFVGFNLWDEEWENGRISISTGENSSGNGLRSKNLIPIIPSTTYYIMRGDYVGAAGINLLYYDADGNYLSWENTVGTSGLFTAPTNAHFIKFNVQTSAQVTAYNHDICINVSKPTGTPKNGDYLPYLSTTLSIPSTRLDGVGTAQDVMYVREDGENDYSLIKRSSMELVDLGTLTWVYRSEAHPSFGRYFYASITSLGAKPFIYTSAEANAIDPKYPVTRRAMDYFVDKTMCFDGDSYQATQLQVLDSSYSDAETLKASLSGVMLCYELATPTETVLASHLTLADISAIAENGGIISVENSNGHIVQPDFVADVVISRSAS